MFAILPFLCNAADYTETEAVNIANSRLASYNLHTDGENISENKLYYVFRIDNGGFIVVIKQNNLFINPVLLIIKRLKYEEVLNYQKRLIEYLKVPHQRRGFGGTYESYAVGKLEEIEKDIIFFQNLFSGKKQPMKPLPRENVSIPVRKKNTDF